MDTQAGTGKGQPHPARAELHRVLHRVLSEKVRGKAAFQVSERPLGEGKMAPRGSQNAGLPYVAAELAADSRGLGGVFDPDGGGEPSHFGEANIEI